MEENRVVGEMMDQRSLVEDKLVLTSKKETRHVSDLDPVLNVESMSGVPN